MGRPGPRRGRRRRTPRMSARSSASSGERQRPRSMLRALGGGRATISSGTRLPRPRRRSSG
eukprot:2421300-Alexandrium_andersonii.AAC.1